MRSRHRRSYLLLVAALLLTGAAAIFIAPPATSREHQGVSLKGWVKGTGWGWIWGPDDEVGALNALNSGTVMQALRIAQRGEVFDLGVTYNRNSFKWVGHNPAEIISFRSPGGAKMQQDYPFMSPDANPAGIGWHSCALFISDNVATQIDTLGHITAGDDNHWYNGYKEVEHGGDFGIRRCDATTIPPIVARGILLDIAHVRGVEALPSGYAITPADVDAAVATQQIELRPGDVVLFRTGTLGYWAEDGSNTEKVAEHDSAGLNLATARYLVEQHGTIMIGSDTSGLEVSPPPNKEEGFIPVHRYLLVDQGVHIAEFHYLEDLAKQKIYEFCYIAMTNKIAGTTAGFAMRPIAIR